ncbi:CBS domain-containing protein [Kangiella profundi]|uniref:CBS domain-containing protein n=2 Tax=Kangiella TaxID=261963 RepID=A0A2K9ALF5_9GAMM|nr:MULTISPECIES: CBS domain-containing protein [Kangiella]AUD79754.1 CBS domain-containing protein [Kangiella profundi]WQG85889.1 CBS domain-containing protein [Kangiella aquimarina]GGE95638.1 CBS domain-containing protein [Kangiella profundi]
MIKSVHVRDYMTSAMITLKPQTDIVEAAQTMLEYRLTGAPVLDDHNRLVGFISEKDCLHTVLSAIYHGDLGHRVMDLMTKEVKTVHPDDNIADVAERFLKDNCRMYPVMEKSQLVGMISRQSILKAIQFVGRKD